MTEGAAANEYTLTRLAHQHTRRGLTWPAQSTAGQLRPEHGGEESCRNRRYVLSFCAKIGLSPVEVP